MSTIRDYPSFLLGFNSEKFRTLWLAQEYVLQSYSSDFASEPDVAIELPTGAGKTLITLLIAESWRQQRKKVAVLSANKTLARHMMREARTLGIPAVLMEGRGVDISSAHKRSFHRATTTAIMNYWVYFNQNPVVDPADLIVMDDAHLAEHCLHSLYSVEIDRLSHPELFDTIVRELYVRFPYYTVLSDAVLDEAPQNCPTELLSFIDQVEFADRLREIVDSSPLLDSDQDLNFRWQRTRPRLREANVYLGLNSIWIRPYIYPLSANGHYAGSQQRLYMSATIGDPGDLSRRLGTKRIVRIPIPYELSEKTSGRRLILLNPTDDGDDNLGSLGAAILAALHVHPKSVWLCSSRADAVRLQSDVAQWLHSVGMTGHRTWVLTPLGNEIDEFRSSPTGHLFVAGRFDGMDFSADECRLVVLATLPRAINPQEDFIAAYLRESGFMNRRLNQRIVQALGRCNRSDEDFGVYILADGRFVTHFGRESNRAGIPRSMMAEIDMAQDLAENASDAVVTRLCDFLNGEFSGFDADLQAHTEVVPRAAEATDVVDSADDEVTAWTALFDSQNYPVAADRFERCLNQARESNAIESGALHGWHWAKALYLQSLMGDTAAREKSLRVLDEAIARGGRSAWFNRLRASLNRARAAPDHVYQTVGQEYPDCVIAAFDELMDQVGPTGSRFDRRCGQITAMLESGSHKEYQAGLVQLGELLGYRASRPKGNAAADCVWRGVFGNQKEVITLEAKIEHNAAQSITSTDIGQANNQLNRATRQHGEQGYVVRAVIVTHLAALEPDAEAAAASIRVINTTDLLELWGRVRLVLSLYRSGWSQDDLSVRLSTADSIRRRLPPTGWLVRAIDSDRRFLSSTDLLAEWP